MRFPKKFSRWVGPGQPVAIPVLLGADTIPALITPVATTDNLLAIPINMATGWPIYRIAVVYNGPANANALQGQLFFWEDGTQQWYQLGAAQMMQPGNATFFPLVALVTPPNSQLNQELPGGLEVVLIVKDVLPTATANGQYNFALGADVAQDGQNYMTGVGGLPNRHVTPPAGSGVTGNLVKASTGRMLHLNAVNRNAAKTVLMMFDKLTAPVNGDTPVYRRVIQAASEMPPEDFGLMPFSFITGIGYAFSSTYDTLTLLGAADGFITLLYQ